MKECCKAYLEEQFVGDADVVNEIYGEYVSSVGEKLAEAEAALSAGEWAALDKVAHAVKGNALSAGDRDMADSAIALRSAAKLQEKERSAQLISDMRGFAAQL